MKRFMLLFVALILTVSLSPVAFAQGGSDAGQTTVDAVVLSGVTVTPNVNVNFDNVIPGVSKRLRPVFAAGAMVPVVTGSPITTAETMGDFSVAVTGPSTQNVAISFILPSELLATGGLGGAIGLQFGAGDAGALVTGSLTGLIFDPNVGATVPAGATGFNVYIGGQVNPPANAVADAYQAQLTMIATLLP